MYCATIASIVCLVIATATIPINAEETAVTEKSFGCIRDSAVKVGGTYIRHADPAKLQEAVQIFMGDIADREYPAGTTIQLIPGEAMVKESKKDFPYTNGWEFFALTVSANGTKIASRGDSAAISPQLSSTSYAKKTMVARVFRSRTSKSPHCKTTTLAARGEPSQPNAHVFEPQPSPRRSRRRLAVL